MTLWALTRTLPRTRATLPVARRPSGPTRHHPNNNDDGGGAMGKRRDDDSAKAQRRLRKKVEKQIAQGKKKIVLPDGTILDGRAIKAQR